VAGAVATDDQPANDCFTSGFERITSDQIPIGKPIRQHGETQGTSATPLANMAQL
jgi:hypothetical protein